MSEYQNITEMFWRFVNPSSKTEQGSVDICIEDGLINAINTFYDSSVIGNLRVDITPVQRALREMV